MDLSGKVRVILREQGLNQCGVEQMSPAELKAAATFIDSPSPQDPAGESSSAMTDLPESEAYLSSQLITYIGNKRSLLSFIGEALETVKKRLGREKLRIFDVFSGSGAVARFFKQHAELLLANDIEEYAESLSRCYLANAAELPLDDLRNTHQDLCRKLRDEPLRKGFITELYAPAEEGTIREGERVFYTLRNARFIDTCRQYIEEIDPSWRPFFTGPLLAEASVHANTAGVFKGFYKDRRTGRGRFGGAGEDALSRITGNMELPFPVFSRYRCPVIIYRKDANELAPVAEECDLAYLDPPYNQHPYGSNYFMLNLILRYQRPLSISPVSGIPQDWNRSVYNKRRDAPQALEDLLGKLKAKFLLLSFNSEGFISRQEIKSILERHGRVEIFEKPYNAFRGSRNLRNRELHVREYLYLVEKY
jgi:adenine-specific DNA-methyltransferase